MRLVLKVAAMDAVEVRVRRAAGLADHKTLHPALDSFGRLVDALSFRQKLVREGHYSLDQIGVFAHDLDQRGAKRWLVDTYAGFAHAASPKAMQDDGTMSDFTPLHLYEVIVENEPCWLYFDLEFSKVANPDADAGDTMQAFSLLLRMFCSETGAGTLDVESMLVLDSSTDVKFSKHVVVKRMFGGSSPHSQEACSSQALAFENTAHTGVFVAGFLEYLAIQHRRGLSEMADKLFVKHPHSSGEVSVIDASVYSRNRCFRALFSSKYGRAKFLVPDSGFQPGVDPALHLLECLVSFVPNGVAMWRHGLGSCRSKQNSHRGAVAPLHGVTPPSLVPRLKKLSYCDGMQALVQQVCGDWDQIRRQHEHAAPLQRGCGGQVRKVAGQYLVVSPYRNRFCLCKGASHRSNNIYLVVDCFRHVYYQKCHDAACDRFRSAEFPLLQGIFDCVRGGGSADGAGAPPQASTLPMSHMRPDPPRSRATPNRSGSTMSDLPMCLSCGS